MPQMSKERTPDPQTLAEYNARYGLAQRIEGYGIETTTVFPCPFCCAPDWLRAPIVETREAMTGGATCGNCGRTARALYSEEGGMLKVELVQVGPGDDGPDFLPIRRIPEPKMKSAREIREARPPRPAKPRQKPPADTKKPRGRGK